MSKHVIITSIDDHYGDFLVNHWLRSLKENVDLRDIDIIILDFGLTTSQLRRLKEEKVIIVPCSQSGHIVNARFTKTAQLLEKNHYDQVLFVDGGDIIFQNNISFLFEQDQDIFRAAKLDLEVLFYEAFIPFNFKGDKGKKIYGFLKDKPVLNAGFSKMAYANLIFKKMRFLQKKSSDFYRTRLLFIRNLQVGSF